MGAMPVESTYTVNSLIIVIKQLPTSAELVT